MIFEKYDFSLQKYRDKMIYTDRDIVTLIVIAFLIGVVAAKIW